MAALKAMTTDTADDPGNVSYEVLQQANRGNHFTVVESWIGREALDGHAIGGAHPRISHQAHADRRRALRRAFLQGAELNFCARYFCGAKF